jgi:hypothetical protein
MIKIYEYLEDFDNAELSEYEWQEQMEEAIESYNEEYGTEYNKNFVRNYKAWRNERFKGDY